MAASRQGSEPPVLVEGFSAEAVFVAETLAREGRDVRMAGPGPGPPPAIASRLRDLGVRVDPQADLDHEDVDAAVAYFDVWTPEVAPRVRRLRANGGRATCIGDLLLERSTAPVLGVTGTAGKTTTTGLIAHLLRAAGVAAITSDASPNANMWPHPEHFSALAAPPPDARLVVELTSSHLAFMSRSPSIAVVTSFWPDHVELHGTLARYRRAKETIVRHQTQADCVVVGDDRSGARFASLTPARCVRFSYQRAIEGDGAYLDCNRMLLRSGREEACISPYAHYVRGPGRARNLVIACAAALAAGVTPQQVADGLNTVPQAPPHRLRTIATIGGVEIVDDGMAATPGKTAATFAGYPACSIVAVCGGLLAASGGPVHDSPRERRLVLRACQELARAAREIVLFGPASERLAPVLHGLGCRPIVVGELDGAVDRALQVVANSNALVFSPMFPLAPETRARFAELFL